MMMMICNNTQTQARLSTVILAIYHNYKKIHLVKSGTNKTIFSKSIIVSTNLSTWSQIGRLELTVMLTVLG